MVRYIIIITTIKQIFTDYSEWLMSSKKAQLMFTKHARHSNTSIICSTQVLSDGGRGNMKNLLKNADVLTIHDSPFITSDCARITRELFPNAPRNYLHDSLPHAHKYSPAGCFEPLMVRLGANWQFPELRVSSNALHANHWLTLNFHLPKKVGMEDVGSSAAFRLIPVTMADRLLQNELQQQQVVHTTTTLRPPTQIMIQHEAPVAATPWEQTITKVLTMIPKTYQKRSERLLRRLQGQIHLDHETSRILWNDGNHGSHIVDILVWMFATGAARDKIRLRKPYDADQFISLLASLDIPDTMVGAVTDNLVRARRHLKREQEALEDLKPSSSKKSKN